MVKNTKGGKGHKSFARKNIALKSTPFISPTNELEKIARVVKFFGNMCQIITQDGDGKVYNCQIRGKFKGRSKRSSLISVGKYVMVGFRHFEAPVFKNCDLLEVYDETTDVPLLKSMFDLSSLNNCMNDMLGIDGNEDDIFIGSYHGDGDGERDGERDGDNSTIKYVYDGIDSKHLDNHIIHFNDI